MNRIDFSDVGLLLQADALEGLRALPDHCAHVCVTSPPYYGLRDYGVEGQMGLEGSVPAYLDAMVRVFREAARVLRPDGTLWLNMGDSYATDSGPQPPSDVVLDPFMGSGTTALTALEEGRRFIGIELNPKYVKLSAARINNALQQGIQTKLEI